MNQIGTFLHDNLLGLILGALVTLIVAAFLRLAVRFFKFARQYGLKEVFEVAKIAFLHIAAYPTIRADAVLTVSYLAEHLASLAINAMLSVVCLAVFATRAEESGWVRWLAAAAAFLFAYRAIRQRIGIHAFYVVTAGQAIEQVKQNNPLLKNLYPPKKRPFFDFVNRQASHLASLPSVTPAVETQAKVGDANHHEKSESAAPDGKA